MFDAAILFDPCSDSTVDPGLLVWSCDVLNLDRTLEFALAGDIGAVLNVVFALLQVMCI